MKMASTVTSSGVLIVYCLNLNSMLHTYALQLSNAVGMRVCSCVFIMCVVYSRVCIRACMRMLVCVCSATAAARVFCVSVLLRAIEPQFFVSLGYAYTV